MLTGAERVQVLLVGISRYNALPNSDLPGAAGDLVAWYGTLAGMGIPLENFWLATSPLGADATRDERAIADASRQLLPEQVVTSGTHDDLLALVKRFVARLGDGVAPTPDRVLVVWTGHGWASPAERLFLATTDTAPDGVGYSNLVGWVELMALLSQRPAEVVLNLALDTCFADAGPGGRGLPGGRLLRKVLQPSRPNDVFLCASLDAQRAKELPFHGHPVGAFSWAVTSVLQRWGQDGADWAITPEQLIQRAGALLFAMDINQTPVVDAPAEELVQHFLHGSAPHDLSTQAPQRLPVIEINPGNGGLIYNVNDLTGAALFKVVVSANVPFGTILPANRAWWQSLPNQSFKFASTSSSVSMSGGTTYITQAIPTYKSSPPTLSGTGGWWISGANTGYMYKDSSSNLVFALNYTYQLGVNTTFTWVSGMSTPTGTYYVSVDLKTT